MSPTKLVVSALLLTFAGLGALIVAAPSSAMPGHGASAAVTMDLPPQKLEQIRLLKEAYRSAMDALDWGVDENGHAAETLAQARDLKQALHAEMMAMLHRDLERAPAARGGCPYGGGKAHPVIGSSRTDTLHL
ncbi:MAG: hypothetical protein RQ729_06225 [Wenzhouxiangellaceae bacterium]|nr:hypothetical protein [Wenzhouxiangellaceae bacterium]